MTTTKRKPAASGVPPDADPGVPPDAHAMLMANPPTEEEKAQRLEDMRQSRRDDLYLDSIKEEVLAEHGDCWIAAYKGEVVGKADRWQDLYDSLEEQGLLGGKSTVHHFQKEPRPIKPSRWQWR